MSLYADVNRSIQLDRIPSDDEITNNMSSINSIKS